VQIFPGEFDMGSQTGEADERPVHHVTISTQYRLQKTEITLAQWRDVMSGTSLEWPLVEPACDEQCPVQNVSWDDVQMFLKRLNARDPKRLFRLPTEAEWEYAASEGGTSSNTRSILEFNRSSWTVFNAGGRPRTVATLAPNAFGLFDMSGNVAEWVSDYYDKYNGRPQTDPRGPSRNVYRVLRGGSYLFSYAEATVRKRAYCAAQCRTVDYGFRLAYTDIP
jgi:formylglycine-generating enzyme required for sulfatase activity